ncbi:hypothetical protein C2E23DRAFT_855507 [Lenzites betulinus]|nr:hypothetical protein C2E23DRAFT_855507 [Lenzites betulinus]
MSQPDHYVNTLHVKVRGTAPTYNPQSFIWKHITWCDVMVVPETPIKIGQRVCLVEIAGLDESPGEDADPEDIETRELGIEGEVVGIRTMEKEIVEFIVENDTRRSMTERVYLTVEYAPGETILLDSWNGIAHLLASALGRVTRRIPAIRGWDGLI